MRSTSGAIERCYARRQQRSITSSFLGLDRAGEAEPGRKFCAVLSISTIVAIRCKKIEIGQRGKGFYSWRINLFAHNDPQWLVPHLKVLIAQIRDRRSAAHKQRAKRYLCRCTPGRRNLRLIRRRQVTVVYPLAIPQLHV